MRETENGFIEGWGGIINGFGGGKIETRPTYAEGTSRGGMHGN